MLAYECGCQGSYGRAEVMMGNDLTAPSVVVRYTPDREDFVQGVRYASGQLGHLRRWLRIEWGLSIGVMLVVVLGATATWAHTLEEVLITVVGSLLAGGLLGGLFTLAWRPIQRRRILAVLAERPDLLEEQSVQLDETGIRHRTAVSETWLSWRLVTRVGDDARRIYLVARTTCIVVPKRAFPTTVAADEFERTALWLWEHAQAAV